MNGRPLTRHCQFPPPSVFFLSSAQQHPPNNQPCSQAASSSQDDIRGYETSHHHLLKPLKLKPSLPKWKMIERVTHMLRQGTTRSATFSAKRAPGTFVQHCSNKMHVERIHQLRPDLAIDPQRRRVLPLVIANQSVSLHAACACVAVLVQRRPPRLRKTNTSVTRTLCVATQTHTLMILRLPRVCGVWCVWSLRV
jgi:hypothetical protein